NTLAGEERIAPPDAGRLEGIPIPPHRARSFPKKKHPLRLLLRSYHIYLISLYRARDGQYPETGDELA
ncbi:MAG: hypothetical protein J6V24_10225, partial [Clostridia bacterium]|nr:hypothetical protein [Clostridia bacterium]